MPKPGRNAPKSTPRPTPASLIPPHRGGPATPGHVAAGRPLSPAGLRLLKHVRENPKARFQPGGAWEQVVGADNARDAFEELAESGQIVVVLVEKTGKLAHFQAKPVEGAAKDDDDED